MSDRLNYSYNYETVYVKGNSTCVVLSLIFDALLLSLLLIV